MDLYFEYTEADYRVEISPERSGIVREIVYHLRKAGVCNPAVYVLSQNTEAIKGESHTPFYLQRYNSRWASFVNVDSVENITDGDKLTVAKIPRPEKKTEARADASANVSVTTKLVSCSYI